MISYVMARLKKEKINAVRVTGKENVDQRRAAMKAFQDPDSDVRAIGITTAGSEAINLQAAKALICIDTPWSAGEFLQLLGRMIRIGSKHDKVYVVHLTARRSGSKKETIDHRTLEVLGKKMNLVEAVLGKRIKGEGDDTAIKVENDISDLFSSLRNDAKGE
jgi:SWI/SNF-related matrix-associated actin-dependent regulator 1 of chromatin subfamily A